MLLSLVKNIFRRSTGHAGGAARAAVAGPVRLHIGGQISHPDWKILDVRPGPYVDFVGHCTDLSRFGSASVLEIYASHVIEHLGYQSELARALREFHRVLVPGGTLRASVPDLPALCALFLDPKLDYEERFHVMRMIYGGQVNEADYHHTGFYEEMLTRCLQTAGFTDIVRVDNFGLFADASSLLFKGTPISLNVRARKPAAS